MVRVSGKARRYAAENGGALYLWVEQQGSRHGWLSVSTAGPPQVEFGEPVDVDGLQVHVQRGMRAVLSRPVTVRLWRYPKRHLDAAGAVVVDPPAG